MSTQVVKKTYQECFRNVDWVQMDLTLSVCVEGYVEVIFMLKKDMLKDMFKVLCAYC